LADAWDRLDEAVDLLPRGVVGDAAVDLAFEQADLAVDSAEVFFDALAGLLFVRHVEPVGFHRPHLDELLATVEEIAEEPDFLIGEGLNGQGDGLAESSQDRGVDGVGLGELPGGPSKVAGAFGLDDGDLEAGFFEGEGNGEFKSAGGFENDSDRGGSVGQGPKNIDESLVSGRGVVDSFGSLEGEDADVEGGAGYVDADAKNGHGRASERGDRIRPPCRPKLALANTDSRSW
jgi:hypothetical protein